MAHVCTHILFTAQACGIWLLVISSQISSASAQTTLQTIDFDAIRARNGMMHNDSGSFQPIQINTVLYAYGANNITTPSGLTTNASHGPDKPNPNMLMKDPMYYWYKELLHDFTPTTTMFSNSPTSHSNANTVRFLSGLYMDAEEQHKKNQMNE